MTYLSTLKHKQIVVLGAGLTGLSCARFLQSHALSFSINDNRQSVLTDEQLASFSADINITQGQWDAALIAQADILLVSPGIDLAQRDLATLINKQTEIIGDVELFCRISKTPTIAVTGSNGKSTVVSLLAHIGRTLGKNVELGGNIGVPVLDQLSKTDAKTCELLILELSSFQLETLTSMNAIAASVLNVSDDHLDRHKTIENYAAIKQKIYAQCQMAVVNRDDAATSVKGLKQTPVVSFGSDAPATGQFGLITKQDEIYLAFGEQTLIRLNELPLAGTHNGLNYLAVLALGTQVGWGVNEMLNACKSFNGLAHRCEKIITDDGVTWINDSKATNVGAALAAINGIAPTIRPNKKLFLIAGGDAKGADFSPLSEAINSKVSHVLTLGKDGQALAKLVTNGTYYSSLEETVSAAKKLAREGDVVLLSPACASIDMFKNFMARGQAFTQLAQGGNHV